jgi:Rod binding domain-containing protein
MARLLPASTGSGLVSRPADDPERVREAASQFEALLIHQMLRSLRESGTGGFADGDAAGECATDFAEQQFAEAVCERGGLGLADLIRTGLDTA